jgi:RNA polymerase sigma factor (sigma-70 family)
MAVRDRPLKIRTTLGQPLDDGAFFWFAFRFALGALARCGVRECEREDLAQEIVIAAWQAWPSYCADLGTPRQWLWGIVRRKLAAFARACRRQPLLVAGAHDDRVLEMLPDTRTWEDIMTPEDRADSLYACLPIAQRRVVWLHETVGYSFEEIAAVEGISSSQVNRLHKAGMETMRKALERDEEKLAAVPVSLASLLAASRPPAPAPGEMERLCRSVLARLGDDAPDSAPPPSGMRGVEPTTVDAPSSRPAAGQRPNLRLVRLLGPIGGVLLGTFLGGPMLPRCDHDHERERLAAERAAVLVAVTPSHVENHAPPTIDPTPIMGTTRAEAPLAPLAHGVAGAADETAILDQGRSALASGDPAAALAAFAEHARRIPKGQHAAVRETLRAVACAKLRAAGQVDVRCARSTVGP